MLHHKARDPELLVHAQADRSSLTLWSSTPDKCNGYRSTSGSRASGSAAAERKAHVNVVPVERVGGHGQPPSLETSLRAWGMHQQVLGLC